MLTGKSGIISSIAFIILALVFMIITAGFPVESSPGITGSLYGSAFFPRITLTLLIMFSSVVLIRDVWRLHRVKKEQNQTNPEMAASTSLIMRALAVWSLCVGFALLWNLIGFLPASIPFVLAVGYVVGARSIRGLIVLIAMNIGLWLIFEQVLKIRL